MYLNNFINQIPEEVGITLDDFIKNHTILPLYKPFMTELRAELVINNICFGGSNVSFEGLEV